MDGESIDARTGLPVASVSAPPELEAWQEQFILGHNDEILRAIAAGEISFDFRPLLMTLAEIKEAFKEQFLGTLSRDDCEQVEDPRERFIVRLEASKPRKGRKGLAGAPEPVVFVVLELTTESLTQQLLIYESPIDVALGKGERVLLIPTGRHYFAYDLETTQKLCRYRIH